MLFKEYKTPITLLHNILSVYYFECDSPSRNKFYLPDGNLDLMIINQPVTILSGKKEVLTETKSIFWGQIRFTGTIESSVPYKVFGIKFQPWLFYLLKKSKKIDMVDNALPLELIFSEQFIKVIHQFFKDWKFEEPNISLINTLSSYLTKELSNETKIKPSFKNILLEIKKRNGICSIQYLTKIYNQSPRTLQYDFKKYTGIKAKEYQNIVQFRKSCMNIKETKNIIHTAIDYGYYDQSHYTNQFTKICSKSPSTFLNEGNLILSST